MYNRITSLKNLIKEDAKKASIEIDKSRDYLSKQALAEILFLLGSRFADDGNYDESFVSLREAEKITKDNELLCDIFLCYVDNYIFLDKYEEAESFLNKCLELTKDNLKLGDVYFNMGLIYELKSEWNKSIYPFEKSIKYFEKVDGIDSFKIETSKYYLGFISLRRLKQVYNGLEILKELISGRDVTNYTKHNSLVEIGHYYFENKDYENALVYYSRSLEYIDESFDGRVYFYMGDSHRVLKDKVNAIRYYEKYLEYDPDDKNTLESLKNLRE
ncbi:MAG: tetratricopeptide repeat protein [Candidatus Aureabacteria bacterium]|nr:tetratricopeptide repeat protein [Candidatus Auribacterota bacterium]